MRTRCTETSYQSVTATGKGVKFDKTWYNIYLYMSIVQHPEAAPAPGGARPMDWLLELRPLTLGDLTADVSMPYPGTDPLDEESFIVIHATEIPERRYPQLRGELRVVRSGISVVKFALGDFYTRNEAGEDSEKGVVVGMPRYVTDTRDRAISGAPPRIRSLGLMLDFGDTQRIGIEAVREDGTDYSREFDMNEENDGLSDAKLASFIAKGLITAEDKKREILNRARQSVN